MRTKGAKNKNPTADAIISLRMPEKLLSELDAVAGQRLQKRSEAILEALRTHVRAAQKQEQKKKKEEEEQEAINQRQISLFD